MEVLKLSGIFMVIIFIKEVVQNNSVFIVAIKVYIVISNWSLHFSIFTTEM